LHNLNVLLMKQVSDQIMNELITEYRNMESQLEEMKRHCYTMRKKIERIHKPKKTSRNLTQPEIEQLWARLEHARAQQFVRTRQLQRQ